MEHGPRQVRSGEQTRQENPPCRASGRLVYPTYCLPLQPQLGITGRSAVSPLSGNSPAPEKFEGVWAKETRSDPDPGDVKDKSNDFPEEDGATAVEGFQLSIHDEEIKPETTTGHQ